MFNLQSTLNKMQIDQEIIVTPNICYPAILRWLPVIFRDIPLQLYFILTDLTLVYLLLSVDLWGIIPPVSQSSPTHSFQCLSEFFWQFYNSLCRNLPRRYVLPLNVDKQAALDQNLVTLHNCKATAKMTNPGEVGIAFYSHSFNCALGSI